MLADYEAGNFVRSHAAGTSRGTAIDHYIGRVLDVIPASTGTPTKGRVVIVGTNNDTEELEDKDFEIDAYSLWNEEITECQWVHLCRDPYSGFYFVVSIPHTAGCDWYCLSLGESGSGDGTFECLHLTPSQLETYLDNGYTLLAGPFESESECIAECGGSGSGQWYCLESGGCSGSGVVSVAILVVNSNAVCDDDFSVKFNGVEIATLVETDHTCDTTFCRGNLILPASVSPATFCVSDLCDSPPITLYTQYSAALDSPLMSGNTVEITSIVDNGCGNFGKVRVYPVCNDGETLTFGPPLVDATYEMLALGSNSYTFGQPCCEGTLIDSASGCDGSGGSGSGG